MLDAAVGQYKLIEELGQGGMGVVYRALHTSLGREVAIKFIRSDRLGDAHNYLARFQREVDLIKRLSHPHIVKVLDGGTTDGKPFLVMELLKARNLRQHVKAAPVSVPEGIRILDQLLDALDYLHAQGMVHRDIKPGNILLDGPERAVLMDFGLARAEGGLALSGQGEIVGTPRYFAPELLMFQPATPATDLWALGCLAYFMFTRRNAFQAESNSALMSQIMAVDPAPIRTLNAGVPPALEKLVMGLLVKDVKYRWASAAGARQALADIADEIELGPAAAGCERQDGEGPQVPGGASLPAAGRSSDDGPTPRSGASITATMLSRLPGSARGLALAAGAALACAALLVRPASRPAGDASPGAPGPEPSVPAATRPLDAARAFARAAHLIVPRSVDRAWLAVRDAVRKRDRTISVTDVALVAARASDLTSPVAALARDLTAGELARAWSAARPFVGPLLADPATPEDARAALLDALGRADAVDALAGNLGLPLPFGVQDALPPALELAWAVELSPDVRARTTPVFPREGQKASFIFLPGEVPTSLGNELLNLTDAHMYRRVEARERVPAGEVTLRVPGAAAARLHLKVGVLAPQTYVRLARPGWTSGLPVRLPNGANAPWEKEKWLTVTLRGALAAGGEWRIGQARAWAPDPPRPYFALDQALWEIIP